MSVATCPPPGDLERLFLGGLPDAEADLLEQHVLECAPCLDQLKKLLRARETLSGVRHADTQGDDCSARPVVDELIKKLESLRPAKSPLPRGTAMITLACSACQKKLSVKENLAGKKVKCPGCGQLVPVPAPAVVAGNEDMRTLPPQSSPGDSPGAKSVSENPTQPPESKPDATMSVKHDARHESSLTDFLAPPQADDELGRLGKYRILKILGHGGMGVVYKGEDLKLKRTVAIKAMLPTLAASASCGKRFLREAEAMAAVEHDHVVRIYQIDEERGIPFMAMEFLKGEPLDERLKRGEQIPIDEVLRIGREIAEGLNAAHTLGLIHRDIKPGNIWLEAPKNRVKILDFGLARAATQEAGLTQQGAIIGTPAYMAPEQGRGADVDARCDLFSLGVVLYRLCTGNQPFHGPDTVSTLMAVAIHDPDAPIKVNRELPPELSDLVMKLLEKDAAKRVATAGEVVQAIQAIEKKRTHEKIAADKTEAITTAAPQRSAGKRSRQESAATATKTVTAPPRRRSMAVIAVGVLGVFGALALLLGGAVFYWQTNNGTVRIEINDPDIQIAFDNKDLLFKGIDKQDIRVSPGEHGLHIKRGDLEFDSDKFILKKGETITLKVEWFKDGKLQVVQGDKVIGAKERPRVEPIGPVATGAFALRFSGQDHVVVLPAALTVDAASDFTMEGFVNLSGNYALLVGTPSIAVQTFTQPWLFKVYAAEGKPIEVRDSKGPSTQYAKRRVHVAGVRAGGKLRLFVDGRLVGTEGLAGKLFTRPNQVLRIGPADGVIDEVRVSKVARYDKDFTPAKRFEPDADTLALYHFDEGSGDVLKDSSGNNHHGKIISAKWVKADGSPIAPSPKEIDLLRLIDPKRDAVAGDWGFLGAKLVTIGGKAARITIPYEPPPEYQIEMVVERKNLQSGQLNVGVIVGGKQAVVCVDGFASPPLSGLETVDGKNGNLNETTYTGQLLPQDRPTPVVIQVRRKEVILICDKKTIFQWKGEPARLGLHLLWEMPNPRTLFLGSEKGIHIHKMTLVPLGEPPAAEPAWVPLFNGKDLTGWTTADGKPSNWKVENAAITCTGPTDNLYTDRGDFADFHLRAEAKINATGNSGIYFRAAKPVVFIGDYEAQICTVPGQQKTGSLWGLAKVAEDLVPPDTWFTLEVIAQGDRMQILVNGKQTADYVETRKDRRLKGYIALQHHDAKTAAHFRKIEVKPLKADGPPPISPAPPPGSYALRLPPTTRVTMPTLNVGTSGPLTFEGYLTPMASKIGIAIASDGHGLNIGPGNTWQFISSGAILQLGKVEAGQRVHLAAVRTDKEIRLFQNGKLLGTKPIVAGKPIPSNLAGTQLGGQFDGLISEVRISKVARYDKDFTPAQRFEPDADTLALYHFDEGKGIEIKDSSGNKNTGVIFGPATWMKADGTPITAPLDPAWLKAIAATPAAKLINRDGDRHQEFLEIAKKGDVEVVFLGDSITAGWASSDAWKKRFEPLKAVNFGIGGDQTGHVLWRITEGGELDGIKPKVAVVLIGTNNVGRDSADDIAGAIKLIVYTIHKKTPGTKILLLGVFPRSGLPALSKKIADINTTIAKLDDVGKTVKFLDIGPKLVDKDGNPSKELMPDGLHLSAKGYEIYAEAITPALTELMRASAPASTMAPLDPAWFKEVAALEVTEQRIPVGKKLEERNLRSIPTLKTINGKDAKEFLK